MPWNSEDPSKPGLGDAIKGIGQVAAAVATGGASAAGEAGGGMMSRLGQFASGKIEGFASKVESGEGFMGKMGQAINQNYRTSEAGAWRMNDDGQQSHVVTQQESNQLNGLNQGQFVRDTGTGLS